MSGCYRRKKKGGRVVKHEITVDCYSTAAYPEVLSYTVALLLIKDFFFFYPFRVTFCVVEHLKQVRSYYHLPYSRYKIS